MSDAGETATFVVGGETYEVPPLTIYALRLCWDDIKDIGNTENNTLNAMTSMLKIVAAGLKLTRPEITFDYLEQRCLPRDIGSMNAGIIRLLRISGMNTAEDGAQGEELTSSMRTGTDSSPSLSPTA